MSVGKTEKYVIAAYGVRPKKWDTNRVYLTDKLMMVLLQPLGTPCSCLKNNCITKLLSPAITFSVYTWFLGTVFWNSFQSSLHHYKSIWKFQTH